MKLVDALENELTRYGSDTERSLGHSVLVQARQTGVLQSGVGRGVLGAHHTQVVLEPTCVCRFAVAMAYPTREAILMRIGRDARIRCATRRHEPSHFTYHDVPRRITREQAFDAGQPHPRGMRRLNGLKRRSYAVIHAREAQGTEPRH